ncbi:MAG: hypothetical protein ACU833_06685 [Gammaproteobacteria bacterium]
MKQEFIRGSFFFCLFLAAGSVMAYGSGSSSKTACKKPKFSDFSPIHLAEVPPQAEFSFAASSLALPETIEVTVKGEKAEFDVSEEGAGYRVTGHLPETLKDTYARIEVKAMGPGSCKGSDGWLVKITGE